ncbi:MAG: hypothetical protein Terrestrivirus5_60 [Terrestrivirus sp.]|uniref:Uncharacterized protein n=1 Tax=Terrestrivirus sp. TaxID=2487775 RepID=A0A3G4ZN11_9VIRU|nr:MAG: hypothetical protein Terrestrivirus5_60 [Terrestrivirus sp.]
MAERETQITTLLVGKTLQEVENLRESEEYLHIETGTRSVREVCINGEHQCCTMDYREDRVNVHTENGKITVVVGFR